MAKDPKVWTEVDRYFGDLLIPADEAAEAFVAANHQAGLPPIDVTNLQGRFLEFLVRLSGARRVLELGTLGGYSTLWMARALPSDGHLVTLELDPYHAEVARANLQHAGLLDRIEMRVGPALETLAALHQQAGDPFDLIFIDADKQNLPAYLEWALKLSRIGSVIVADNVVREGKVVDSGSRDRAVIGVRQFTEVLAAEPRLSATVLQTVGVKGYDGFALALVIA